MTLGYTLFCAIALGLTLGLELLLRTGVFRDRRFWITIAIVAFFQVIVDGWLTCRPVVTYSPEQFSGIRLGCPPWSGFRGGGMPLEDALFGFAMISQGLMWWVWWGRRDATDVSGEQVDAELRTAGGSGGPGGDL